VCDYSLWSENESVYLDDEDGKALYGKVKHGFKGRTYVEEVDDFADLADGDGLYKGRAMPCRVFGVAQVRETLQHGRNTRGIFDHDPSDDWQVGGQAYIPNVPTLEMMAKAALEVLEQDEAGFFLMVEGGAIDWASHGSNMARMLEENIDFDHTVQTIIDWVEDASNGSNWQNTLVIVTADHECGHLQPVGQVTGDEVIEDQCWGVDCQKWSEHTNSLVPIYAQGPGAESLGARFNGDYRDNTDIFRTMYGAMHGDRPIINRADP
jgi:alkaline phosphatase